MPRHLSLDFLFCLCLVAVLSDISVCEEPTLAVPDFPRVAPIPADKTGQTFHTLHGFQMQLVASEPLIADPVDVAYDEHGRAYVAEMRDYPYPEEKGAVPKEFPGRITLLEDADGDGDFDNSFLFADQLSWPTSVACWKGGVFVAAAPDIWYFRDDDGDRRADVRRRVYTGFSRDNVQAIVNGLRWGLDNRIYGAASGNGGSIQTTPQTSEKPIVVTRQDFRFDPATESFQAIPGGARFGNTFDDWGNRFVCNIRNPVQQVMVSERYWSRNPLFAAPSAVQDVAEAGDQLVVFRRSPPESWRVFRAQRWSVERVNFPRSELLGAGYWTSSSGVTIYRGSAYPEEFRGNAFIGEVAGNLIHRQQLVPNGVTFQSRRADQEAEFVASTDIWFRPVNFLNAPDGTLHVLDMYRETIEHPWSIPDDIKGKLDLTSGNDRGRIYRLAPAGFQVPPLPRLAQATIGELVAYLEHPNAWHRETAQRLLYERQDPASVEPLRNLLTSSKSAVGRLHALFALAGQQHLASADLLQALSDPEPQVRRHAVQLSEPVLATEENLRNRLYELALDESPVVRFQLAMTLGEVKERRAAVALAQIAASGCHDEWMRAAVFSSAGTQSLIILQELLRIEAGAKKEGLPRLVRELAYYAAASAKSEPSAAIIDLITQQPDDADSLQFALLAGLGLGLERRQRAGVEAGRVSQDEPRLQQIRDKARRVALDSTAASEKRLAAIELFRFAADGDAVQSLSDCLDAREPLPVQLAAIQVLRLRPANETAVLLTTRWQLCSAAARQEIVESLLSRANWAETLIAALEANEIATGQLTIPQRARLVGSAVPGIKDRAIKLLGPGATSKRGDVVRDYRAALSLPADRTRGELVFRRECQTCHRMGSAGHDVGPNLNSIKHRAAEEILVHMFDPNRDVPPQFVMHTVQLRDGRVLTGVVVSETDSSVELQRAENARDTVLRRDIEALVSSGKSLMPDGIEQKLSKQDVADLLAYVLGGEMQPAASRRNE